MKLKTGAILMGLALLLSACPAPDYDGVTVTGTIDLTAVGTGGTCYVVLQNDVYAVVAETSGAYAAGGTLPYTLGNVLQGSYYLYVWLDYGAGDAVPDEERYYGSGILPNPPASPNVTVPFSGTVTVNLSF